MTRYWGINRSCRQVFRTWLLHCTALNMHKGAVARVEAALLLRQIRQHPSATESHAAASDQKQSGQQESQISATCDRHPIACQCLSARGSQSSKAGTPNATTHCPTHKHSCPQFNCNFKTHGHGHRHRHRHWRYKTNAITHWWTQHRIRIKTYKFWNLKPLNSGIFAHSRAQARARAQAPALALPWSSSW